MTVTRREGAKLMMVIRERGLNWWWWQGEKGLNWWWWQGEKGLNWWWWQGEKGLNWWRWHRERGLNWWWWQGERGLNWWWWQGERGLNWWQWPFLQDWTVWPTSQCCLWRWVSWFSSLCAAGVPGKPFVHECAVGMHQLCLPFFCLLLAAQCEGLWGRGGGGYRSWWMCKHVDTRGWVFVVGVCVQACSCVSFSSALCTQLPKGRSGMCVAPPPPPCLESGCVCCSFDSVSVLY